ncbi:HD family hydrolase [Candidatus Curtissbacteria bacterium]|nr:HD family hydrolase [Candidatus Curtissbacteria bacterium]
MKTNNLTSLIKFFLRIQWTKELPRQGFVTLGFKRNEADSVAAHSFATAILAYELAILHNKENKKPRVDENKVLKMALFHDLAETIVGDVGSFVKYLEKGKFRDIEDKGMEILVEDLVNKEEILSLYKEYSERKSLEARFAKAADHIDAIAQIQGVPAAKHELEKKTHDILKITRFPWHQKAITLITSGKIKGIGEIKDQK